MTAGDARERPNRVQRDTESYRNVGSPPGGAVLTSSGTDQQRVELTAPVVSVASWIRVRGWDAALRRWWVMSGGALFLAVFLACVVEAVEALTIVLAAG